MRIWVGAFIFAGLMLNPSHAAEVIGHAAAITNQVEGKLGRNSRRLNIRDTVHYQELIKARAVSTGQFRLLDGSKIVVGPGAALRLDNFVYSGKSAKGLILSAAKGAFRFISGKAGSSAYRIKTPVAVISVRGTAFDFYVGRGTTSVILLRGAVRVCSTAGQCRTLRRPCEVVRVTRNAISPVYRGADRRAVRNVSLRTAFPFVHSQRKLLRSFRSGSLRGCESSNASANPTAPSVAAVSPSPPAPSPPAPSPPGGRFGNPGNDAPVGRSGESPNGSDFGGGTVGKGDVGQGGIGVGLGLAGLGNGPGGNGPGGNGPGGNGPGGNGPGGNGPGGNGPGGNGPGGNGPGGNGPGGAGPGGPGGPGGAGGK